MSVTIPAVPQIRNCGFDTAAEVVVIGNISLSFQPVQLNWLEVWEVGWRPEELTASILGCLLHLAAKEFRLVEIQPNDNGDLELFG